MKKTVASGRWEFVLQVEEDGYKAPILECAADELRTDRELVLEAVQEDGRNLWYAPQELKRDREVVLQAVAQKGLALGYAADELRRDKEIVLKAVKQNGRALPYAAEELRRDREIVLAALQSPSGAIRVLNYTWSEAGEQYRQWRADLAGNRSFLEDALMVVKPDEVADLLEFGSFAARSTPVLQLSFGFSAAHTCIVIVAQGTSALEVKERAWLKLGKTVEVPSSDVALVLEGAGCQPLEDAAPVEAWPGVRAGGAINRATLVRRVQTLARASADGRQNLEFVLPFVQEDGLQLQWAHESLQDVEAVVSAAVRQNGLALQWASTRLRDSEDLVLAAAARNPSALRFASGRLKRSERFVSKLLLALLGQGLHAGDEECRQVAFAVLDEDPSALQWACLQHFQDSLDVVLAAVGRDFNAFMLASERLRDDEAAVMEAMRLDFNIFEFASHRLRHDRGFLQRLLELPAIAEDRDNARLLIAMEIDDHHLDLRDLVLGVANRDQ